jgi:hypothetical protein
MRIGANIAENAKRQERKAMMTNKWVQAALCSGFGIGLIIGAVALAVTAWQVVLILGIAFQMVGLWITANARGTDGFGGPYNGPRQ